MRNVWWSALIERCCTSQCRCEHTSYPRSEQTVVNPLREQILPKDRLRYQNTDEATQEPRKGKKRRLV